ncbi:hypothetical protein TcasGA2_TC000261 [Tribolium castaneum]|uniref:Uncharacterized protein n=1 Tax=Tribolium castaneum TaxID=7070 RepID=D6WBQ2_TRICA|nr:hypothetical protein TcasGA2_TC000261 [Tribolium castaneum]
MPELQSRLDYTPQDGVLFENWAKSKGEESTHRDRTRGGHVTRTELQHNRIRGYTLNSENTIANKRVSKDHRAAALHLDDFHAPSASGIAYFFEVCDSSCVCSCATDTTLKRDCVFRITDLSAKEFSFNTVPFLFHSFTGSLIRLEMCYLLAAAVTKHVTVKSTNVFAFTINAYIKKFQFNPWDDFKIPEKGKEDRKCAK